MRGATPVCLLLSGIATFFSQPSVEPEVPADVAQEFDSGRPVPIASLV